MPLHTRSTRRGGRMKTQSRVHLQDPKCNTGNLRVKSNEVDRCRTETHSQPQLLTIMKRRLQSGRALLGLQCLKVPLPNSRNRPREWSTRNKFVRASLSKPCKHSPLTRHQDCQSKALKSCLASRPSLLSASEKS